MKFLLNKQGKKDRTISSSRAGTAESLHRPGDQLADNMMRAPERKSIMAKRGFARYP